MTGIAPAFVLTHNQVPILSCLIHHYFGRIEGSRTLIFSAPNATPFQCHATIRKLYYFSLEGRI